MRWGVDKVAKKTEKAPKLKMMIMEKIPESKEMKKKAPKKKTMSWTSQNKSKKK